ncbi:TPA: hypothetical protein DCY68_03330, partial [Candidatus Azambacteria bacterium]|nr:hypothetical protein [Candidatus Azambacteria bacterium]
YGFARLAEFERDIQRLQKGEPVAYVIGFVDFLGCKIDLSFRPLIPRPETEFWTEKAIEDIEKSGRKKVRCLDIFAGSGCIGVAVLKHAPVAVVDFAEKEKKFLEQIKLNARLNNLSPKRRKFIQSDIFSNISGIYDYIFANPPYVAKRKNAVVQKSVLEWEPAGAIFGGRNGLFYINKFLKQARGHLKPEGKIYMEFDSRQKNEIAGILKRLGYGNVNFYKDQYGRWRYLTAGKQPLV